MNRVDIIHFLFLVSCSYRIWATSLMSFFMLIIRFTLRSGFRLVYQISHIGCTLFTCITMDKSEMSFYLIELELLVDDLIKQPLWSLPHGHFSLHK